MIRTNNMMRTPSSGTSALSAALALSAIAGCTAPVHPAPAAPRDDAPPAAERGMRLEIQPGQLGFDHSLQVRTSLTGIPHELRSGDTVKTGDRILVQVQTSVDAYLYLAFCSTKGLEVYPPQGGVRARAGVLASLPEGFDLVVDKAPGTEVLYVIASAADLPTADPRLVAALASKRPGGHTEQDCGPTFEASLGAPASAPSPPASASISKPATAPAPHVIRGRSIAKRPAPVSAVADALTTSSRTPPRPPDPDFVRSPGDIVWYLDDEERGPGSPARVGSAPQVTAADSSGIAIVRHVFTHVANR